MSDPKTAAQINTTQCGSVEVREDPFARYAANLDMELAKVQSKLTELESCLKWCSENVVSIEGIKSQRPTWICQTWAVQVYNRGYATAPTLTDALMAAWKARGDK